MNLKIYEKEIDGVHILYADVSELDTEKNYPDISDYRRDKLSRLKRDSAKKLSLGAELLLISALKKYYPSVNIPFRATLDINGKPRIDGVHFNLSHAGNVAVCAVADTEVGVDIERSDRSSNAIAKKYFNETELNYSFSYIWTRKEAVLKADGRGISYGLKNIDVTKDIVKTDGKTYRLISIKPEITGYDIAICVL